MRFLHLGDLHLGKSVNEYSMIDDQRYILAQILEIADTKKVDAVLIAGDIYDKSIPSEEAVGLLNDFIMKLAKRNLPAYIITGNHDSDERLNFGSALFEANGIHIGAKYDGQIPCYEMEDEYGTVEIHLLPFVKASTVRHFYPEEKIENYDDAIRVALKQVAAPVPGNMSREAVASSLSSAKDDMSREAVASSLSSPQANVFAPEESAQANVLATEGSLRKVLVAHQFVIGSAGDCTDKNIETETQDKATVTSSEAESQETICAKATSTEAESQESVNGKLTSFEAESQETVSAKATSTEAENQETENGELTVSRDPVTAGSENVSTLNVGTVEKVDVSCFDGYDYVALGHIHSPQKIGRETVHYSGSPLKYSLSEINNEKSVPIITIKEKGHVEIECLPLVPRRQMRHLKGKIDQILDPEHIEDPDDYIYVTLTDEITIMDAMARVQHFYPNTMRLDYDNAHTKSIETADFSDINQGQSFEELMEAFYASVYQQDISEEEMKILQDVAKEAGVLYDNE